MFLGFAEVNITEGLTSKADNFSYYLTWYAGKIDEEDFYERFFGGYLKYDSGQSENQWDGSNARAKKLISEFFRCSDRLMYKPHKVPNVMKDIDEVKVAKIIDKNPSAFT
jgi:hypothetical protein